MPVITPVAVGGKIQAATINALISAVTQVRFKGSFTTSKSIPAGSSNLWGKTGVAPYDVIDDPLAGFNSTTGVYTAPYAGTYIVMAQIKATTAGSAGNAIWVTKNGANAFLSPNTSAAFAYQGTLISGYLRLAVGDTVACYVSIAYTTQSDSPADNNFFEIVQVGS